MNDNEQLRPQEDTWAWSRLKRLFGLRQQQNPAVEPEHVHHQSVTGDDQTIAELRGVLADETTARPAWANKEVDMQSINLYDLPIGWKSLTNLGKEINNMKDEPLDMGDLADIRPPPNVYPALPMVASVIAHTRNPEIPVVLPAQTDVKAMKPWLGTVERFIGRFSQNWARKFGWYVEKRGQRVVEDIGFRICAIADQIGAIENPRQRFLTELTDVYNQLAKPEHETVNTFFGDAEEKIAIEDKIHTFLLGLRHIRDGGDHGLYTKEQFPLLNAIIPIVKFPPDSMDVGEASVAGAELMEGIHTFLRKEGVAETMPVPRPREIDIFNPSSWMRGLAETFFVEKLEKVKRTLPDVLVLAHQTLPVSGPQLSDAMYRAAENICVLKAQGRSADEIARHVFVT